MMLLVTVIMPHTASSTPSSRTQILWRKIQREYDFLNIDKSYRFSNMKLSMFTPKGLNIMLISKRLRY